MRVSQLFGLIAFLLGICLIDDCNSAETRNILYYGWFIDETTAQSLSTIANKYLKDCYENSTEFSSFMDSALVNSSLDNPFAFYTKPLDPNTQIFDPFYHTTAKFCGGANNCSPYSDLDIVANSTCKEFEMELIGLYFTNRTYGIRVKLSAEQELLYQPDSRDMYYESDWNLKLNDDIRTTNAISQEEYPGIDLEPQDLNLKPSTLKAHVTIGCAPGIPAQVTGDDLGIIIDLEQDSDSSTRVNITIDNALMVHYGEWDAFVIYPDNKMKVKAKFQPYYSDGGNENCNYMSNANTMSLSISLSIIASLYFIS